MATVTGAHRARAPPAPAAGSQLFNLVAIAVVPLVTFGAGWVPAPVVAFPVAGVACSSGYVLAVTLLFRCANRITR